MSPYFNLDTDHMTPHHFFGIIKYEESDSDHSPSFDVL